MQDPEIVVGTGYESLLNNSSKVIAQRALADRLSAGEAELESPAVARTARIQRLFDDAEVETLLDAPPMPISATVPRQRMPSPDLGLVSGVLPIQRLKRSDQFEGLTSPRHDELIRLIDEFHVARAEVGTEKLDESQFDRFWGMLTTIRRAAEEAAGGEVTSVIEDVGAELEFLDSNDQLRAPTGGLAQVGQEEALSVSSSSSGQEALGPRDRISDLDVWVPEETLGPEDRVAVMATIRGLVGDLAAPPELVGEIVTNLWHEGELSSNYAEVLRLVRPIVGLAMRIVSIARQGILPPSQRAQQEGIQASSDVGEGRGVSHFFDIQQGRSIGERYPERFPKPGMSSASAASEREDDLAQTALWAINLAEAGQKDARNILINYAKAVGSTEEPAEFIEQVAADEGLLVGLGHWIRKQPRDSPEMAFLRLLLTGRAHYTAMFASTGLPLEESAQAELLGKKGLAPDVRELESTAAMRPESLTHVIVPEVMTICKNYLRQNVRLRIIFVPTTVARDFSVFDRRAIPSQVQPGDVLVPDYDSAISELASSGGAVLTHITRGPA